MRPSRREELIEAAMKVFYRDGFNASGIDRVLAEAGISKPTLYHHFRSKEDLIVAALRREDEIQRTAIAKEVNWRAATPRDRLLTLFDVLEDWVCTEPFNGCMFLNACAEFPDVKSPIRRAAIEHKRLFEIYLFDLARATELEHIDELVDQVMILVEGSLALASMLGRDRPGEEARRAPVRCAKRTVQILMEAMRSKRTSVGVMYTRIGPRE